MTTWISFDLDFVTGDNRVGAAQSACPHHCPTCGWDGAQSRPDGIDTTATLDEFDSRSSIMEKILSSVAIDPPIIIRDNHAYNFNYLEPGDTVYLFDSHDDMERFGGVLDCGNWVTASELLGVKFKYAVSARYSLQLADELDGKTVRVFIAVSTPYAGKHRDAWLFDLLVRLQVKVDMYTGREEYRDDLLRVICGK